MIILCYGATQFPISVKSVYVDLSEVWNDSHDMFNQTVSCKLTYFRLCSCSMLNTGHQI